MLDVARAVSGFAHWLEENIGRSAIVETVSYMGVSD